MPFYLLFTYGSHVNIPNQSIEKKLEIYYAKMKKEASNKTTKFHKNIFTKIGFLIQYSKYKVLS